MGSGPLLELFSPTLEPSMNSNLDVSRPEVYFLQAILGSLPILSIMLDMVITLAQSLMAKLDVADELFSVGVIAVNKNWIFEQLSVNVESHSGNPQKMLQFEGEVLNSVLISS